MAGMLFHPLLQQRTITYPVQYKPKKIEERVRRSQSRQLTNQIDCLLNSKNSSLIGLSVREMNHTINLIIFNNFMFLSFLSSVFLPSFFLISFFPYSLLYFFLYHVSFLFLPHLVSVLHFSYLLSSFSLCLSIFLSFIFPFYLSFFTSFSFLV